LLYRFFSSNGPAAIEIFPLSLHDALPIWADRVPVPVEGFEGNEGQAVGQEDVRPLQDHQTAGQDPRDLFEQPSPQAAPGLRRKGEEEREWHGSRASIFPVTSGSRWPCATSTASGPTGRSISSGAR